MDLVNGTPRSPYESLHGIVMLPRAIDKVRAEHAGTLGDYLSRRGFSADLFEFLGVAAADFAAAAAAAPDDEAVWAWIESQTAPKSPQAVMTFNRWMMTRAPQDEAAWTRYRGFLAAIGQAHRTDLVRQFDRLDLDEGREVPLGGRV